MSENKTNKKCKRYNCKLFSIKRQENDTNCKALKEVYENDKDCPFFKEK